MPRKNEDMRALAIRLNILRRIVDAPPDPHDPVDAETLKHAREVIREGEAKLSQAAANRSGRGQPRKR